MKKNVNKSFVDRLITLVNSGGRFLNNANKLLKNINQTLEKSRGTIEMLEKMGLLDKFGVKTLLDYIENFVNNPRQIVNNIKSGLNEYEILGVKPTDDVNTIKARYKQLAKILHPDKGGDPYIFNLVTQAYKKILQNKGVK